MITAECLVVSYRADGSGVVDSSLKQVATRTILNGVDTDDWLRRSLTASITKHPELAPLLERTRRVAGQTMLKSGTELTPFKPCRPRIITPEHARGYELHEITDEGLTSCRARAINNRGTIVGDARQAESRIAHADFLWVCRLGASLSRVNLYGTAADVNDNDEVAARAYMEDGTTFATRWRINGGEPFPLGPISGCSSTARAINKRGVIVGSTYIAVTDQTQQSERPTIWLATADDSIESNRYCILGNDLGYDWGYAVDVNDTHVLVVGYVHGVSHGVVANFESGKFLSIGGPVGAIPTALAADGRVLGHARNLALLTPSDGHWAELGTPVGLIPEAMNDEGDVVGHHQGQPWLRRPSGEILWLPYFEDHHCRPLSINDSRVIVGTAGTDHGEHALVWTPPAA